MARNRTAPWDKNKRQAIVPQLEPLCANCGHWFYNGQCRMCFGTESVMVLESEAADFRAARREEHKAAEIVAANRDRFARLHRDLTVMAYDPLRILHEHLNMPEQERDAEWLADETKSTRIIVTAEFAKRWTNNPQHYRDHFGLDDVTILEANRP